MNISRRSFLKLAALSTAAVAVSASMTGCSSTSILNPNVSIVLQEKKNSDKNAYIFTSSADHLKDGKTAWKDGRKVVSSENVSITKLADKTPAMSAADAKALLIKYLEKDYDLGTLNVYLTTGSADIPYDSPDPSHYVLTIEFELGHG